MKKKAKENLTRLTIASMRACLTSVEANTPITISQAERLEQVYAQLLDLQQEIACGPNSNRHFYMRYR